MERVDDVLDEAPTGAVTVQDRHRWLGAYAGVLAKDPEVARIIATDPILRDEIEGPVNDALKTDPLATVVSSDHRNAGGGEDLVWSLPSEQSAGTLVQFSDHLQEPLG